MNFDIIGGKGYEHGLPPNEEGLIGNTLPNEVFLKIISHLDGLDRRQANLVSRRWSGAVLDSAKREEFAKIKGFANFLGKHLQKQNNVDQGKKLFGIANDTKILDSVKLTQVKSTIYEVKENFIKILKDLKEDELKNLGIVKK